MHFHTPKVTLDIPTSARSHEQVMERVKQVLAYSVRTNHPMFLDKLYVGRWSVCVCVCVCEACRVTQCVLCVVRRVHACVNE
jgi:hypothetical protein